MMNLANYFFSIKPQAKLICKRNHEACMSKQPVHHAKHYAKRLAIYPSTLQWRPAIQTRAAKVRPGGYGINRIVVIAYDQH
jgi:hypothetical protein